MNREQMITHLVLHGWEPAEILGNRTGLINLNARFLYYSPRLGRIRTIASPHIGSRLRLRKPWRSIASVQLEEFISFLNEEALHGQDT